jgi:hypothetical protein
MKKLELVVGSDKDPRENFKYIQFNADGYVYATNGFVVVKCPIEEVLGQVAGLPTRFYVLGKDWGRFKFSTAVQFVSLGDGRLVGFNAKHEELGSIKVLSEDEFVAKVGRFVDIERAIPSKDAPLVDIPKLGINVDLLSSVCKALGFNSVKLSFRGENSIVQIEPNAENAGLSVGYIMPLVTRK